MSNPAEAMPFAKLMGVNITKASAERVVGELIVRPDLCTAGDIVHGGALMAFADALAAVGAYMALPKGALGTTTIESKTNFLGAAKVGAVLRGEAAPEHRGKRTSVWQTRICDESGRSIALVTQTQMALFPAG